MRLKGPDYPVIYRIWGPPMLANQTFRAPAYLLHALSGLTVATLNGRDIYPGVPGIRDRPGSQSVRTTPANRRSTGGSKCAEVELTTGLVRRSTLGWKKGEE